MNERGRVAPGALLAGVLVVLSACNNGSSAGADRYGFSGYGGYSGGAAAADTQNGVLGANNGVSGATSTGGALSMPGMTGGLGGVGAGAGDAPSASPDNGAAAGASTGAGDWCAVDAILSARCTGCHGSQLSFGAPMSLVTYADIMAASPTDGRPNYQVVLERVVDSTRPMPPIPNPRLEPTEIAALQAWVTAGMPDNQNCGATVGGSADGATVGVGPACSGAECDEYSCTTGTPIRFLAHGQPSPGDSTPYDASVVGSLATAGDPNYYQCFYFKVPWTSGTQASGFRPIIDNSRVLHHWLLYASDQAPADVTEGGMRGDCQLQGDANRVLLAGWAPGTPPSQMPEDVGIELPAGNRAFLTLEIHYYNTMPGAPASDQSGVELCLLNQPRVNAATQHWLGTEKINVPGGSPGTASDTCTPNLRQGQTSTLISVTPHMHKIGVRATLEVLRANGQVETLHDAPFLFENQTTYRFDQPVTVYPGDRLRATCRYQNTGGNLVAFGEGSDEEMCYLFTTAYPPGSLHNGRNGCFLGACVPGGIHRCIDNESIFDAVGGL